MKKTILSLLILSLSLSLFAQGRRDDKRYDDKRGADKRYEEKRYEPKYPTKQSQPSYHKQPSYYKSQPSYHKAQHQKQVVVVQKAPPPKPTPVKFVVKKEKPKKYNPWKTFVRAVLAPPAPPPRAVVVLQSTYTTPVYEMYQLDRQPQLIESPTINYPENMANAGISGEVTMDVQIDKNGYVGLERVVSSTNKYFEKEAISSLNTFKYEHPLKNGYPVNASFTITIPFEISE